MVFISVSPVIGGSGVSLWPLRTVWLLSFLTSRVCRPQTRTESRPLVRTSYLSCMQYLHFCIPVSCLPSIWTVQILLWEIFF